MPEDTQTLDTRKRILDAACALVVRDGYVNLTLDAVAREATVSKGGLLYHFPSKRALLEGMVAQRCESFEREVHRHLERESGPGRWLRAITRAACSPKDLPLQEGAAIFAVLANDPELLEVVRERRRRFQRMVDQDGIDPLQSAVVLLAIDGLCFTERMGLNCMPDELRERVIAHLMSLTEGREEGESEK